MSDTMSMGSGSAGKRIATRTDQNSGTSSEATSPNELCASPRCL
jgi:hypothetical protein